MTGMQRDPEMDRDMERHSDPEAKDRGRQRRILVTQTHNEATYRETQGDRRGTHRNKVTRGDRETQGPMEDFPGVVPAALHDRPAMSFSP